MTRELRFHRASRIEADAAELGEWHFREGAIHRLIPPWERIDVIREAAPLAENARAELVVRKGPLRVRMEADHRDVRRPVEFTDVQLRGPFASWSHTHRFLPHGDGTSTLEDAIRYRMPFGPVGRLVLAPPLGRELERQFAFRHARTREDLRRHAELAARFGAKSLRIGVTGAGGLVGRQLCAFLSTGGHDVVRFVRGAPRTDSERRWNPRDAENGVDPTAVADLDAIVHLAGEPIAAGRWTPARKQEILASRVEGTKAMARAIARAAAGGAPCRLRSFICASAIGFYGDRGEAAVDERDARGTGFLADVVSEWESATSAAREAGVRTVQVRIGFVVAAAGGGLARMRLPFSLGLGGPLGNGRQGMSWIALDDLLAVLAFAVMHGGLHGPVNAVAPAALPQRGFAKVLGRVLGRPAIAPLPGPVVRTLFGEMGQRLLLEGVFVRPRVLQEEGFRFAYGDLERALRMELGRMESGSPVGSRDAMQMGSVP